MATYSTGSLPFVEQGEFLHRELIDKRIVKSCLNCVSFEHIKEVCLEYHQHPPAQVICFGCPTWEQDIPF